MYLVYLTLETKYFQHQLFFFKIFYLNKSLMSKENENPNTPITGIKVNSNNGGKSAPGQD